jgi:hypothetical protein
MIFELDYDYCFFSTASKATIQEDEQKTKHGQFWFG